MTDDELEPFIEDCLLANTPEFLLARIFNNPKLPEFLAHHSTDELLMTIREANVISGGAPVALARGHLAAVALLKRAESDADVIQQLRAIAPFKLRWLPRLIGYWEATRRASTLDTLVFATATSARDSLRSNAANSNIKIVAAT
jgi:hypothetical protein